jgi:hypothetical protein
MAKAEKICKAGCRGRSHREWKKEATRIMRRLWKARGEDAPKRVPYRGYSN